MDVVMTHCLRKSICDSALAIRFVLNILQKRKYKFMMCVCVCVCACVCVCVCVCMCVSVCALPNEFLP